MKLQVVGHIPVTDGPVKRFLATQHYSSYYLYAEHDAGKNVTLIDVTKTAHPAVLADVAYPPAADPAVSRWSRAPRRWLAANRRPRHPPTPQTIRIMDFSDPKIPKSPANSPASRL